MRYYLNNCRNYPHREIYGGQAMFDLWTTGPDGKVADELTPGDSCVVASYAGKTKLDRQMVLMESYRYIGKKRAGDAAAPGGSLWVLEGNLLSREELRKEDAAASTKYAVFFNKVGHFKQLSVIRGT